ncbi:hypothetical protein WA026_003892 [Henosepilachna vigintioctopunctata]|uniref:Uncharacterized protein n=1 Tax=Henosepilachna vigintioctopunctata TaxID=420089 RepID=A0AAW1UEN6_9CUCU
MMFSILFSICLLIVFPAIGGQLPPYLKPCQLKSPDFTKCAIKNANSAIPSLLGGVKEFDVPSFTPLRIPLVQFSSGDLFLNGTDLVLTGFPDFTVTNFLFDPEKRLMGLDLKNPKLEIDLQININGKIGSLRIEGNGPAKFILYAANYMYRLNYTTKQKKGKTHAIFEKDDFEIKPENLHIHIDNLFNGNKLLGDNMNKVLNENWPEVLKELRPVISEVVGSIIRRMLVNLFRKVPLEELLIGY